MGHCGGVLYDSVFDRWTFPQGAWHVAYRHERILVYAQAVLQDIRVKVDDVGGIGAVRTPFGIKAEVKGEVEWIGDNHKQCIYVCNHQSILDSFGWSACL